MGRSTEIASQEVNAPTLGMGSFLISGGALGQAGGGPGQPGLLLNVEVGGPVCGERVGDS